MNESLSHLLMLKVEAKSSEKFFLQGSDVHFLNPVRVGLQEAKRNASALSKEALEVIWPCLEASMMEEGLEFSRANAPKPYVSHAAQNHAIWDVLSERDKQDAKWGEQNHEGFIWLAILTEEVGELAQAILHTQFGGKAAAELQAEAVQVAAVALAIVECLNRHGGKFPFALDETDIRQAAEGGELG